MKEMTNIYGESLEVLTASGLASGMLFVGRMLARKADGGTHSAERHESPEQRAWSLCGGLNEFVFDAANSQSVSHTVTHLQRPSGLSYLVFAQSAGNWQHRLVLPLVGEEGRSFLRSARKEPVRFSLSDGARRMALVYEGPDLSTVLPGDSCVIDLPQDIEPLLQDILHVSTLALLPWFFASLGKQTPLTCVSSIYPPTLFAEMEKQPTQFSGEFGPR